MKLSKSAYMSFLDCPREFWLAYHRPDLFARPLSPVLLSRMKMGYGVQEQAVALFAQGDFGEFEVEKRIETDRLLAKMDIYAGNSIYEVKGSNSAKKEYAHDLAFQKIAAEVAGVPVERTYLVHLNREYVRRGRVEPEKLLAITDMTDEVNDILEQTRANIETALDFLALAELDTGIEGYCKSRKLECEFIRHHHPDLPEYTIFNISRLSEKSISALLASGVIDILDVPADFKLSAKQRMHVDAAQENRVIAEGEEIARMIKALAYPHYFLDYETVSHAIPMFDGYRPYQNSVFQFSLHVQKSAGEEVKHYEFLAEANGEPVSGLLDILSKYIAGEGGTVIVWNKTFEAGCNNDMALLFEDHTELMTAINERMFDLRDIFSKDLYIHPQFKGRSSLKKVLPIMVPGRSYDGMVIDEGMLASVTWLDMFTGETPEALWEHNRANLLEYCKLDTLAMVEILDVLRKEFCR